MKDSVILKSTSSNEVYKKVRKRYLENKGKINCAHCPYHKGENSTRDNSNRSWKNYRRTQYK